ncbi:hypothetical protein MVEN_02005400 [Mycena venus]|uniref:Uncharacterized protein n=1 Tax=Mycena venus TaxID=2733690 RepID=A0A8H7CHQ1_9AGAR|nr:hypothetical protein MVEN_02005400 [Mycena venus]
MLFYNSVQTTTLTTAALVTVLSGAHPGSVVKWTMCTRPEGHFQVLFDQTPQAFSPTPSPNRKPPAPCASGCGQAGNVTCIGRLCKNCCLNINMSIRCPAPRHHYQPPVEHIPGLQPGPSRSVGPPEQPLVYAKAYAKPISPTYAAKLRRGDFTVTNIHNRAQAESYRVMADRQIKCYWFTKDNEPPKLFMCTIPNPPANFFHPKDDAAIAAVIGQDKCNPYVVLVGPDWVTTTNAQRVQPNDILCFRSLDVSVCIGGPFAPAPTPKRRLSLSGEDDISPAKIGRHSSVDSVSVKTKNAKSSDQVIDISSDDEEGLSIPSSPRVPETPTPKRFPLKWACDMDRGFHAMEKAEKRTPDKRTSTVAKNFAVAFAGYKEFCVKEKGLDLDTLKKMFKIQSPASTKKPPNIAAAIKLLTQAPAAAVVDWDIVNDLPEGSQESHPLETLITSLLASGHFAIPEGIQVTEARVGDADDVVPVQTRRFSYEESWSQTRPWPFIIYDAKVDNKINDPKLIVLDFSAADPDPEVGEAEQDLVVMQRFNRQTFHVYKTVPVDLSIGQIASEEATTCLVHTSDVLKTLFKVWAPTKCDNPVAISYALPGYGTDQVSLLYLENGWTSEGFKNGHWCPEIPLSRHSIPLAGPENARRILLELTYLEQKALEPAAEPTTPTPPPRVEPPPFLFPSAQNT